jgi:YD repeat-containing protein
LGNGTTYEYDLQTGVLLSVQLPEDSVNAITTYTYDEMYRLKSVSEGKSGAGTVSYTYQFDQLSSISKPGTSYAMSYNGHNDLTKISVGTSVLAAYSYTNDHNRYLSSLAYGNGDVVEYTYDELGRVTREDYRENGSTAISRTVAYTYSEAGNLSKMTDSKTGMTTTYSYDPLGRLVSSYETDGTSKKSSAYSYTYEYEYRSKSPKKTDK